jgi:hypothetical protein
MKRWGRENLGTSADDVPLGLEGPPPPPGWRAYTTILAARRPKDYFVRFSTEYGVTSKLLANPVQTQSFFRGEGFKLFRVATNDHVSFTLSLRIYLELSRHSLPLA